MDWIDLRSDTVTHPTPAMRAAMAEAEVGDDVFGDDPTVHRLEEMAAERLGKEAGLFVASGTMGNLAAILAHCQRGDEIILGDRSHTYLYEAGGVSALGGVHPRTVPNLPDGTLALHDIEAAIRPDGLHFPISRLILLENTQNSRGGAVLSAAYSEQVGKLANEHELKLHLDGARIFNASAALEVPAAALAGPADSVTFSLSKGLCAPVGSVICGNQAFIHRARRARKQLGGGMRQAGVLAAAGIVALQEMAGRLREDHLKARKLAKGLAGIPGIQLEYDPPPSNMVYILLSTKAGFTTTDIMYALEKQGIKVLARDDFRMRLVLHYWIDEEATDRVISEIGQVASSV